MSGLLALFAGPAGKWILRAVVLAAVVAAAIAVLRGEFRKGERAGKAEVVDAVQSETIRQTEKARIEKEKINEGVRRTPFDDRVDELR